MVSCGYVGTGRRCGAPQGATPPRTGASPLPDAAARADRGLLRRRRSSSTRSRSPARSRRSSGCRSASAIAFLYLGGLSPVARRADRRPAGQRLRRAARSGRRCCRRAGNLLEVIVAVLLLRRLVPDGSAARQHPRRWWACSRRSPRAPRPARRSARSRSSPAASSTSGAVPTVWRTWWLGDFIGALVLVPLALDVVPAPAPGMVVRASGGGRAALVTVVAVLSEIVTQEPRAADLPRLPGPDPGGAAFRRARARRWRSPSTVGFTVWNTTQYDGRVRRLVALRRRAQHPAVHRGGGADHVLPRRGGAPSARRSARACARRAPAWSRPPTRSGAGSSATSTTARSSGSPRSPCTSASRPTTRRRRRRRPR